jgi:plasmid stabilization system protein ParE
MKLAVFRPEAEQDLASAIEYYERESSGLGVVFSEAFQSATGRVVGMPGLGNQRYDHVVAGLRMYVLQSFPYVTFYFEREACVEIVRLLHSHRDLAAAVQSGLA